MKPKLGCLIALGLLAAAAADAASVDGWPGGAALVKSYAPEGDVTVGRIEADGTIVLDLPQPTPSAQTVDQTFAASCSGDGGVSAGPLDVGFTPTSLFAERDGQELGALHLATSREVVAWRNSYGEQSAAKGAWYQWVHVAAAATVNGDCTTTTWVDAEATESYEQFTGHKVAFQAGWNLMRNEITELYADKTGKQHAKHVVVDVLAAEPEAATWFFVGY